MSIVSHFEQVPDQSFVRAYDPHTARRQFWSSVVLLVVLCAAAFLSGVLVRSNLSASPNKLPAEIVAPKIETPKQPAPKQHKMESRNVAVASIVGHGPVIRPAL